MRLPLSSRLSRRTTGRRDKDSALMSGGRLDEDWPAIDAVNIIKAVAFSAIRMAVILAKHALKPSSNSGTVEFSRPGCFVVANNVSWRAPNGTTRIDRASVL